jgi:hypothetical protein
VRAILARESLDLLFRRVELDTMARPLSRLPETVAVAAAFRVPPRLMMVNLSFVPVGIDLTVPLNVVSNSKPLIVGSNMAIDKPPAFSRSGLRPDDLRHMFTYSRTGIDPKGASASEPNGAALTARVYRNRSSRRSFVLKNGIHTC